MEVSTFDFNFIFTSAKLNAICHKTKALNYLQIRASIQNEKEKSYIRIFYETDDKDNDVLA